MPAQGPDEQLKYMSDGGRQQAPPPPPAPLAVRHIPMHWQIVAGVVIPPHFVMHPLIVRQAG
jgi:hypothetical protein